ncbi:glycine cleavage system H protein, partial [Lecanoromycetidae sp. Uapishka_2]
MANIIRISRHGLKGESNDSAQIVDFEVIASYNWLDEGLPTILVPGIPPLWAPPYVPPAIKKDSGIQFVDQNADRTPGSPLQAMIQAAHTMKPDFDLSKVNIVTDRSPIRKLLGFVSDEKKPFKFGVTIHGNTALITRIEKATRASYSDFGECHGFRVDFETKHTKIANFARASTSHHRIVTYKLGGLIFLVRYAVDAYFGDKASTIMKAKGIENTELGSIVDRIDHTGTQSWSTQAGIEPLAGSLPNDTPVTVLNGGLQEKKYTTEHEWIELSEDGKTGTIGVSVYAAQNLGDVVYVELPTLDLEVSAGDSIGAVESVKSASDIMTPVSGKIIEANDILQEKPGTINKGPESEGWIARIQVKDAEEVSKLMSDVEYGQFTAE